MTTPVTNPTTFTINDPQAVAQGVTGFNVKFGRTSGNYTLNAAVPAADLTTLASGVITGKITDLENNLAAGTWFAVATAVNPLGETGPTPEISFVIVPPASPPTSFQVA